MKKVIPFLALTAAIVCLLEGKLVLFTVSFIITGVSAAMAQVSFMPFESPDETIRREHDRKEKIKEYEK